MNQRDALRELINASHLDPKIANEMLSQVDTMPDENVAAIGKALAEQLAQDTAAAKRAINAIDEALAHQP